MMIDVILLSFLIAFLRKGRITELPKINSPWLILAAMGLQLVAVVLPRNISPWLILFSYFVLLAGLGRNLDRQSMRLIFVGVLLNVIAIGVNIGRMPVSLPAAERLGFDTRPLVMGTDYKRVAMSDETRFNFLGDVIYVPFPMPRVVSIGDLAVAGGAFVLVQEIMNRPITLKSRSLTF
jgi:hypothetical protein